MSSTGDSARDIASQSSIGMVSSARSAMIWTVQPASAEILIPDQPVAQPLQDRTGYSRYPRRHARLDDETGLGKQVASTEPAVGSDRILWRIQECFTWVAGRTSPCPAGSPNIAPAAHSGLRLVQVIKKSGSGLGARSNAIV